jgi:hypothetical protein
MPGSESPFGCQIVGCASSARVSTPPRNARAGVLTFGPATCVSALLDSGRSANCSMIANGAAQTVRIVAFWGGPSPKQLGIGNAVSCVTNMGPRDANTSPWGASHR